MIAIAPTLSMGLLAVTAMVAVNQDAYGQEVRQSVENDADAKGRVQLSSIGPGERGTPASFTAEKTSWRGFDRFDFLMDAAALTVQPIKASPDEETRINAQVKGKLRCIVVVPKEVAPGTPWVLRADSVSRDALVDLALLDKGFHIVIGPRPRDTNVTVMQEWNAVYKYLVDQGFSTKPVMEGAGGAAGEAYAWAIANPDKVSCIYGENPVLRSNMSTTQPIDNLAPLANAGVHILHVCGSLDPSLKSQTRIAEKRYQELGGRITVIIKEGEGHYPLAPSDRKPVVGFILKSVAAGSR